MGAEAIYVVCSPMEGGPLGFVTCFIKLWAALSAQEDSASAHALQGFVYCPIVYTGSLLPINL